MQPRTVILAAVIGLALGACLRPLRPTPPSTPPSTAIPPPVTRPVTSNLLGTWDVSERAAQGAALTFDAGGALTFAGKMESFNPARWTLDRGAQELSLILPSASNEDLDIFRMYVGQGVKAFDRPGKRIVYHFDAETYDLNVAGWTYRKREDNPQP